ncbi:MAG: DUF2306 domain-containing protein [Alphaproteobacteria bacterium]
MTRTTKAGRLVFWVLSFAVALASWRFLLLGFEVAFPNMVHQLMASRWMFYVHVAASPLALLIVPFQLSAKFRSHRPARHRLLGRLYCLVVLAGGISGLIIAFNADGGLVARAGFLLLSLVWLGVTARAVLLARAGRFGDHRRWMIRSAALTFAAVTLRLWLAAQLAAGVPFDIAYPIVAWGCWVLNLAVVEFFLQRSPPAPRPATAPEPGRA